MLADVIVFLVVTTRTLLVGLGVLEMRSDSLSLQVRVDWLPALGTAKADVPPRNAQPRRIHELVDCVSEFNAD